MAPSAIGRLGWVQVDCADPVALAAFWTNILGVDVRGTLGGPDSAPQYVFLNGVEPGSPRMCFQRVAEAKSGKNRLHLDISVADLESATEAVVALGATRVPGGDVSEHELRWRVMADPEGNEFCLVPDGSSGT